MTELPFIVETVFVLRRFIVYFQRKTPQPANQIHNVANTPRQNYKISKSEGRPFAKNSRCYNAETSTCNVGRLAQLSFLKWPSFGFGDFKIPFDLSPRNRAFFPTAQFRSHSPAELGHPTTVSVGKLYSREPKAKLVTPRFR